MHPVNKLLSLVGLKLSRIEKRDVDDSEKEFIKKYDAYYELVENNKRGFKVYKAYRYEVGEHPIGQRDYEEEFAAYHIFQKKPETILDIGSFRHFILGLLSYYNVTTIDIRNRKSSLNNETILTCDAKDLSFLPGNSFDVVLSLQALPHFGLTRYGDEFDLDADIKAFNGMIRVLRPSGLIIFSTAITGRQPSIAFNARRNYNYEMIREFCKGLDCIKEKFFNRRDLKFCSLDELTTEPTSFDYYLGCWEKK